MRWRISCIEYTYRHKKGKWISSTHRLCGCTTFTFWSSRFVKGGFDPTEHRFSPGTARLGVLVYHCDATKTDDFRGFDGLCSLSYLVTLLCCSIYAGFAFHWRSIRLETFVSFDRRTSVVCQYVFVRFFEMELSRHVKTCQDSQAWEDALETYRLDGSTLVKISGHSSGKTPRSAAWSNGERPLRPLRWERPHCLCWGTTISSRVYSHSSGTTVVLRSWFYLQHCSERRRECRLGDWVGMMRPYLPLPFHIGVSMANRQTKV
jgi:succinate dehydrogenase/fumarate reductase cytochrome b subunit